MSGGMINITKQLKRQGLDPRMTYEGIVVDREDPRKLCRVRVRVKKLFDGLEDKQLPWAIPDFNHIQGANVSGKRVSGISHVPKLGFTVGLKFPLRDIYRPVWTSSPVTESTISPAMAKNYPDRVVLHMSNGAHIIMDTKTNELYLSIPGDLHLTVLGSLNQYVVGNQNLTVAKMPTQLPPYLLNAPDGILAAMPALPFGGIPFPGLLDKGPSGNQHSEIYGDQTVRVHGNKKEEILGTYEIDVKRSISLKAAQRMKIKTPRIDTN